MAIRQAILRGTVALFPMEPLPLPFSKWSPLLHHLPPPLLLSALEPRQLLARNKAPFGLVLTPLHKVLLPHTHHSLPP